MKCDDIKKMIPVYLDGELKEPEAGTVKEHLAECASCRKEAHAFGRAWKLMGEYADIEPDSAYVSRFWTELARRKSWVERLRDKFSHPAQWRPAFVTLSIIVLLSVIVFRQSFTPSSVGQQMVAIDNTDLEIIENIELVEDLDLIQDIEFWQDIDDIEQMDTVKGAVS